MFFFKNKSKVSSKEHMLAGAEVKGNQSGLRQRQIRLLQWQADGMLYLAGDPKSQTNTAIVPANYWGVYSSSNVKRVNPTSTPSVTIEAAILAF